jgi:hypothetical protein
MVFIKLISIVEFILNLFINKNYLFVKIFLENFIHKIVCKNFFLKKF